MSNAWSGGYNAAVDYTFGYYPELGPQHARLAMLMAGFEPAAPGVRCELGFGQGVSVNLHAAASGESWWGTDFSPAQTAAARELAKASRATLHLFDQSFEEFCRRDDLPDFDSIGLHGIWSWISAPNRGLLVEFFRRKLRPGGYLYLSYNTTPGWALTAPLRHLMSEYLKRAFGRGESEGAKVRAARAFLAKVTALEPRYVTDNPQVLDRVRRLEAEDPVYLAHEMFGEHWDAMSFVEVADLLAPAGLTFVASADLSDHVEAASLSEPQRALLAGVSQVALRESVRGFITNRQFRRDYWRKGGMALDGEALLRALHDTRIVLATPRAAVPTAVRTVVGEALLDAASYGPILDALADHRVRTVREVVARIASRGLSVAHVLQASLMLGQGGHIALAQPPDMAVMAGDSATRFNAHVVARAAWSDELAYLASPVTGGAVRLAPHQLLFLRALGEGVSLAAWPQYCLALMRLAGRGLQREGRVLTEPKEMLAELRQEADWFANTRLDSLRALRVL